MTQRLEESREVGCVVLTKRGREVRLEIMDKSLRSIRKSRTSVNPVVLVVGPVPPPVHGVSVATQLVLEELPRRGISAIHINTSRPIRTHGLPAASTIVRDISNIIRVWKALITRKTQIVYLTISQTVWGLMRDALMLLGVKALRGRAVVHLHGGALGVQYRNGSLIRRISTRGALRSADAVIVLGIGIARTLDGLVPRERCHVIPNGVPEPPVRAPWVDSQPSLQGLARPRLRVLFLSNLIREKGPLDLLEAVGILRGSGLEIQADFAGEDVDGVISEGVARATQLGIGDVVRFLGPVFGDAKWRLLASSHVLVLPTYYVFEGLPIALVEGLAVGLPIIATPHGAIEDLVHDGLNGFLVPPKDPDAIANALRRLALNPSLIASMGKASRNRYEQAFTADRMLNELVGLLKRL